MKQVNHTFSKIKAQRLFQKDDVPHRKRPGLQARLRKMFAQADLDTLYVDAYPHKKDMMVGQLAEATFRDYHHAIKHQDFLLADGIAIQLGYFLLRLFGKLPGAKTRWLNNLNGTDFVPKFFDELKSRYGSHKISLMLYGSYPEYLRETESYFKRKGINVVYAQDGYREFDWKNAANGLHQYKDKINILLVARSHPALPVQELWVQNNLEKLKEHNLICFTVGGLFDHLIGAQKRAPKLFQWIKLERLFRLITNPKRNSKKVANILSSFKYIF